MFNVVFLFLLKYIRRFLVQFSSVLFLRC